MFNSIKRNLINIAGRKFSSLFDFLWPPMKILIPKGKNKLIINVKKVKEMIEEASFKITKDKHLMLSVLLKGETSDIKIDIALNNLLSTNSEVFFLFEDVKISKEWMYIAFKNFVNEFTKIVLKVEDDKIYIKEEVIMSLKKIL